MNTKKDRIKTWLVLRIPIPVLVESFEVFFASFSFVVGILALLGLGRASTMTRVLPHAGIIVFNLCLVFGALALLVGITGIREKEGRIVYTRLPMYKLGLRLLGLVCMLYGLILILVAGLTGLLASIPLVAFSLTCGVKLLRISTAQALTREDRE